MKTKSLNKDAASAQRGINMVDLMMWLVIAALLLAAAIQSIGYYQQSAFAYAAKEDVMSIQKWAAANGATTSKAPSTDEVNTALTNGDLKLTSDDSSLVASVGAKYCVGVYAPRISTANKVFYSTSDAPSNIIRASVMPSSCGTVANAGSNGGTGSGSTSGTGATPAATLPAVSTARLKFGVTEPLGPLSTQVDNLATLVNEYPGVVSTYKDWGSGTNSSFNKAEVDAVFNKGSQAMITWEPFNATNSSANQPAFQTKNIYNGNYDAYIKTWTDSIAATSYNKPILIRFAHEMNGNWYPWADQVNGNADGDYKKAWKYVYDKFTAAGIQDKVDWVWAANIPYTGSTDFYKLYPGDAYVDIIGLDGFNYGTTESWSTWKMPWDILGAGLWHAKHANGDASVENTKPIIITETGSAPTEGSNSQGFWASELIRWLNASEPKVVGFVWFDQIKADQLNTGGGVKNWRIDSTPETSNAVKDALAARR